jgi:ATP-dependent Clp protease ATP-binding subunit ClpC
MTAEHRWRRHSRPAQRIEVAFTEDAVDLLARDGFDPQFGARPLRRTIQRLIENQLSRMVLSGETEPGDRVVVDVVEGDLLFEVEKGAGPQTETGTGGEATATEIAPAAGAA